MYSSLSSLFLSSFIRTYVCTSENLRKESFFLSTEKSFLNGCKEGGKCIAVVDAADRHGTSLYVSAEFDSRLSGRSSFRNGSRKCSSVLIFTGYHFFFEREKCVQFLRKLLYIVLLRKREKKGSCH